MNIEIPASIEPHLQRVETPWGVLVGIKPDRITRTIVADGQYEWAETAIVGLLLRAGATTFDVGANIGYYTALFQRLVGAKGSVHSFEANPFTAALLNTARAENGWENVRVNNLAVGDIAGQVPVKAMDLAAALADNSLNLGGWTLRESKGGGWNIDVVTLDQYVRDHRVEKVHLLKVDVEGFELRVLEGGDTLIRKFRPYIIMEMRAEDEDDRARCTQMLSYLEKRDFACCRIMKRPFPHFRAVKPTDFDPKTYHFNVVAMPAARFREYEDSRQGA